MNYANACVSEKDSVCVSKTCLVLSVLYTDSLIVSKGNTAFINSSI